MVEFTNKDHQLGNILGGVVMAEKLVTLATFDMPFEAHLAKGLLETNDVSSFLADEFTVGVAWHLSNALGGIKLQVAETDAERAIPLLKGRERAVAVPDAEGGATDAAKTVGDPVEIPLSISETTANRALHAALLGLFFPPLQLYSLWLIGRLFFLKQKIGRQEWKKIWVAGMLDLMVLGTTALLFFFS